MLLLLVKKKNTEQIEIGKEYKSQAKSLTTYNIPKVEPLTNWDNVTTGQVERYVTFDINLKVEKTSPKSPENVYKYTMKRISNFGMDFNSYGVAILKDGIYYCTGSYDFEQYISSEAKKPMFVAEEKFEIHGTQVENFTETGHLNDPDWVKEQKQGDFQTALPFTTGYEEFSLSS